MSPVVRIPAALQPFTEGRDRVEIQPGTLDDVLRQLDQQCPGLQARICDAEGELQRYVNVYVNRQDARRTGGLQTPVGPDDEVMILPAIAGGRPHPSARLRQTRTGRR